MESAASLSDLVLGIDASTTACKAIAFDARGVAAGEGRAPIALQHPAPDAWEQDAEAWWTALGAATRELTTKVDAARIVGLSIAQQRETFVVTSESGEPLAPGIVWMDHRCKRDVTRAIEAIGAERLHAVSGKPPCTTPSLYKIMGLFAREPTLLGRTGKVLDVHALLAWRLTGRCATSLASADPTGMLDMVAGDWSAELFSLAGLARRHLPELALPGVVLGRVTREASLATGLPEGLPVVAGAGDGQAAGLGAGLVDGRTAYLNLGTAVVSGVLASSYRHARAFRTLFAAQPGSYFLETDLQGGTFTVTWLVEKLLGRRLPEALVELEAEASRVAPGADGLVLVPYWNGVMNPYWDDFASGLVVGLRGHHGPGQLLRALYEGLALEQRLHTMGVEEALGERVEELVVVGGGSKSALLCQIVADVLGRPIARASTAEATALGAAMLAAVGTGMHPTLEAAAGAMTARGERFLPGEARRDYDALFAVYRTIYPALRAPLAELERCRS